MGVRRTSREWAVQLLFQLDLNPTDELEEAFRDFWAEREDEEEARPFAEELVRGVRDNAASINEVVSKYTEHWAIGRIGPIERNVMRLAIYEMLCRSDIPPVVSINEAVDIAKFFCTSESGRFVNGVLDRVRKELPQIGK